MSGRVDIPSPAFRDVQRLVWRRASAKQPPDLSDTRLIPEEVPVAFSYEGTSYAVMMATPADLRDFAFGFSLNEGIVGSVDDIDSLDIVQTDDGTLLRMYLAGRPAAAYWERRRHVAGPSGCGLCGLESLAEAVRQPHHICGGVEVAGEAVVAAMGQLPALQPINCRTRAVHAAAFWTPKEGILAVREDVGRHNALDKLTGAMALAGLPAAQGAVLLTSRVSVEMVQKTASLGAPILVAVSAPTSLAVKAADAAGITLIAVARQDGFETFTHAYRVLRSEHRRSIAR